MKVAVAAAVLASAILSSCMPSQEEIEQDPIEENNEHTPIITTVQTETPERSIGTTAVSETEVATSMVTHTTTAQKGNEHYDQHAIAETALPGTVEHTSTATAAVTETEAPTSVVTHNTIARRAADDVASYWTLVNNRDYESAWYLLSDGFRQRKHSGDYSHYQNTYQEMKLCSVEAIKIETIAEHEQYATVSAHLSYLTGSACDDQRDFLFEITLTRESGATAWKIDVVSPVANRDISLDATAGCDDTMAAVIASSLNVRTGPGAGRAGEALYPIQSYLQKGDCVTATATNPGYSWVRISNTPRAGAEDGWVAASFLRFGGAHPGPPLLPVVAEPTPPPTAAPPPNGNILQPIGIEYLGNAQHVCYDIQGSSGPELALQMDRLGPYDSDGNKTWAVASLQFVISGGTCYSDGTVDLSDVAVTLNSTITMPCWYPPAGTSSTEISRFDDLMQMVARHELRHVEIAWHWAQVLERRLTSANTCDEKSLNTIYNQVWADAEAAQDAFHASPEGQIVPFP